MNLMCVFRPDSAKYLSKCLSPSTRIIWSLLSRALQPVLSLKFATGLNALLNQWAQSQAQHDGALQSRKQTHTKLRGERESGKGECSMDGWSFPVSEVGQSNPETTLHAHPWCEELVLCPLCCCYRRTRWHSMQWESWSPKPVKGNTDEILVQWMYRQYHHRNMQRA